MMAEVRDIVDLGEERKCFSTSSSRGSAIKTSDPWFDIIRRQKEEKEEENEQMEMAKSSDDSESAEEEY